MTAPHDLSAAALHHGGALDAAIVRHGGARTGWLDLSTGINPAPPPLPALSPDLWTRLPERALEEAAIAAARRFYGAPPEAGIVAAPGSQALISLLPHLRAPGIAALFEPTYGEHRSALVAAGHEVVGISDLHEVPDAARLAVVVNPNNPDGRLFPATRLLDLADLMARRGGLLVVDEAFMDVDPAESLCPFAGRDGLLVHRSFGKVFGYGGLRLGFAVTTPSLAQAMAERLGPWAVSGPALFVGARMMGDAALASNVRAGIAVQAILLRQALAQAGLGVVGGTGLFALVQDTRARDLFEVLCRRHVLTRPFAYRSDWLRFGNPRDEAEAARLVSALVVAMGDPVDPDGAAR